MAGQVRVDRRPIIAPSLLSANPTQVGLDIDGLMGEYDWLHVDVMDGHFVPNITYGPAFVAALRRRYSDAYLDVHLMVDNPERCIESFVTAGASMISVHAEATVHLHRLIGMIKELGASACVALNPATGAEFVYPVLHMVDMILVMSVNPGFGGQKFIPEVMGKVTDFVRYRTVNNLKYLIEMDGGLGPGNCGYIVKAGCDVIVAGSAVFGAPCPVEAIRQMRAGGDVDV